MSIRWMGAILVFIGCGGFGCSMAAAVRAEERDLGQLLRALEFMDSELSYRLPPLEALCRSAGAVVTGPIRQVLLELAGELEIQTAPEVSCCMEAVLSRQRLPDPLHELLLELGKGLGRFDLPGQLKALGWVKEQLQYQLDHVREGQTARLRNYQTLGLCAGAALAILFL